MRALVLEGGGMRAAYANGVLAAFEDTAVTPFDVVYGTSAGGALAAWWSARQARYALDTWRYVRDPRVLSWRRWVTGRGPLLDHDLLFGVVYAQEHPLDLVAVAAAPHPVIVTATDADTGRAHYQDVRGASVLDWLRATARLPVGAGPAVEIDGVRYLDGGLADPIPIARAIQDGAKEVVCVLNEPPGPRRPERALARALVARRYPALRELIERHHALHDDAIALARRPPPGVEVRLVHPSRPHGLGRLTRDLDLIQDAIVLGRRDGAAYFRDVAAPSS